MLILIDSLRWVYAFPGTLKGKIASVFDSLTIVGIFDCLPFAIWIETLFFLARYRQALKTSKHKSESNRTEAIPFSVPREVGRCLLYSISESGPKVLRTVTGGDRWSLLWCSALALGPPICSIKFNWKDVCYRFIPAPHLGLGFLKEQDKLN